MSAEDIGPMFDFAHRLAEREFRVFLALAGWCSGTTVIVLAEHQPWTAARELVPRDFQRVLAARQNPESPHGWELRQIETGHDDDV